ncbi:MAG TPA: hypothetical protein VFN25_03030, partial [Dokdonella sp.]|uniref:hypothetical protein n=1 Tax=Dokdonella sp. TaxID=2291710 RepID=UPI002D7E9526
MSQMETHAQNAGQGTWTIWNPLNGEVAKFRISCGGSVNVVEPTDGPLSHPQARSANSSINLTCQTANFLTVSPEQIETAANLSYIYNHTNGSYKSGLVVQLHNLNFSSNLGYDTISAHDYLGDNNLRSQINDVLTEDALASADQSP